MSRVQRVQRVRRVLLVLTVLGAGGCARSAAPVPLAPAFASKDEAAQAVLDAVWRRDEATLASLAVSESEFLKHVWPVLPASAAAVGMPAERAWADQRQKNEGYRAQLMTEHGGRRYELVAVSFGSPAAQFPGMTLYPETRLDVRDQGQPRELRLFGSMIESGGRWKIYSFIVD